MNRALLEALARGVGLQGQAQRQRDLGDIAGTWKKDPAFDQGHRGTGQSRRGTLEVRVALDTNGYVDSVAAKREPSNLLEKADSIHLPFVVLAELRAGFAVGRRGSENERVLGLFLGKPGCR